MSCNLQNDMLVHEPFRMNDGRQFTDYRSHTDLNKDFVNSVNKTGCNNNNSYTIKQCAINNFSKLFEKEFINTFVKSGVYKCECNK